MKMLSISEINQVSGGMASMSGSFSAGRDGMSFQPGFVISVTGTSANVLGNFRAYSDRVIDGATGTVLFDGTQKQFCINGSKFRVAPIEGGHSYHYSSAC